MELTWEWDYWDLYENTTLAVYTYNHNNPSLTNIFSWVFTHTESHREEAVIMLMSACQGHHEDVLIESDSWREAGEAWMISLLIYRKPFFTGSLLARTVPCSSSSDWLSFFQLQCQSFPLIRITTEKLPLSHVSGVVNYCKKIMDISCKLSRKHFDTR